MGEDIWRFGNDNKKISGHYHKLNKVNEHREMLYFGAVRFWNKWYLKHCKELNHSDDKKALSLLYKDILLKGTEKNFYFDLNKDFVQFDHEQTQHQKDPNKSNKIWSYRDYIYDKPEEEQIDIKATELPPNE